MPIYKSIKFLGVVVSFSLLSGCLANVSPMSDKTYSINCTGWPMTMETCYNSARSYCPNGYTVLSNQPKYVANITMMSQELAPNRVKIRGMVIKCK